MPKKAIPNLHDGSTLESFLESEGTLHESTAVALKRVVTWQLRQAMKEQRLSKKQMSERMETSRAQLDRILDPENVGISLESISRAAQALGKRIGIEIADHPTVKKVAKTANRKKPRAA